MREIVDRMTVEVTRGPIEPHHDKRCVVDFKAFEQTDTDVIYIVTVLLRQVRLGQLEVETSYYLPQRPTRI